MIGLFFLKGALCAVVAYTAILAWVLSFTLLSCSYFVPHEPPCVMLFGCTGGAASPKAAFGVVKDRLGI